MNEWAGIHWHRHMYVARNHNMDFRNKIKEIVDADGMMSRGEGGSALKE